MENSEKILYERVNPSSRVNNQLYWDLLKKSMKEISIETNILFNQSVWTEFDTKGRDFDNTVWVEWLWTRQPKLKEELPEQKEEHLKRSNVVISQAYIAELQNLVNALDSDAEFRVKKSLIEKFLRDTQNAYEVGPAQVLRAMVRLTNPWVRRNIKGSNLFFISLTESLSTKLLGQKSDNDVQLTLANSKQLIRCMKLLQTYLSYIYI